MKRATDVAPKGEQSVAEMIRAAILSGEYDRLPWTRPWNAAALDLTRPYNGKTGRPYKGWANHLTLGMVGHARGYGNPRWVTFKQALDAGVPVAKGEKAVPVEFWMSQVLVWDKTKGEEGWVDKRKAPSIEPMDERLVCRIYLVFNEEQLDGGLPAPADWPEPLAPWSDSEAIKALEYAARKLGVTVRRGAGGNSAYYKEHSGVIDLPRDGAFMDEGWMVSSLAHEVVHATKGALGRPSVLDEGYCRNFEEVVAEAGAWMLTLETGLPHEPTENHAVYLSGWGRDLREDLKALDKAMGAAQKASRLIAGHVQEYLGNRGEQEAA